LRRRRGTRPLKTGRPWSAREDELARTLPALEVARRTERTLGAVYDRRRVLKTPLTGGPEGVEALTADDRRRGRGPGAVSRTSTSPGSPLSCRRSPVQCGVMPKTVSAIETGQYCPSALLAFLLAKQLGKRVDELFFLEGDSP
jgi:putative transcriptional regulator